MRVVDGKLKSALDELRAYWNAGNYRAALKLAASWPRLGKHKDAIKAGWAAASNPRFYLELGRDPQHLYTLGVDAVADRYNLKPAAPTGATPKAKSQRGAQ